MRRFPEKESPIILVGMHRSGSSLAANLLNDAGLDIGERLMPGKEGSNSKGFFENLDFVELHETILDGLGLSRMGWTLQKAPVATIYESRISEVLERNQRPSPWGWKDPRSTLFMDYWAQRLPGARFIAVVRSPWEVVDSLYRRGDELFMSNPRLAFEVWIHYNRAILDFLSRHPDRLLIVNLNDIIAETVWFISTVNARFGTDLATPGGDIFDPKLLNRTRNSIRQQFTEQHFPDACRLWKQLNHDAARPSQCSDVQSSETPASVFADEYCRDWQIASLASATAKENVQLKARLTEATEQMHLLNDQTVQLLEDRRKLVDENNRLKAALGQAEAYVANIQKSRIWPVHRAISGLPEAPVRRSDGTSNLDVE